MADDQNLVDFFSLNYSSFRETQQLWKKVGGNPSRILDMESPRTRWTNLMQQVNAGAVSRIELLVAALEDFPGSTVLLADLAQCLPLDARAQAKNVLESLSTRSLDSLEEANQIFIPLQSVPEKTAVAAVAVELAQAPDDQREQAKSLGQLASEKVLETVVTEGTRVFLNALPLLGPLLSGTAG